ncbi:hypothetical protein FA13DRAFT_1738190 [Coprinellus micaceus]|uniref:Uncharacterized protein n=1 Tax=Coprinellus micaceus TaxID=71717 RepID=A0A4Y7SUD1_COPMI|nr:hypothetical protein FA13DRAFT_1738190 [Coprinellus micaceus]
MATAESQIDHILVVLNMAHRLYGATAKLDFSAQETDAPRSSLSKRWVVVARILPYDSAQHPCNIGLGYGATFLEAKTAAAGEAVSYFLANYRRDLEEEGVV